jgi:hypothetical protein
MNPIHRALLLVLAAALLPAALPAQPIRSDPTGPIPTGPTGMGYPVVPVRDIEGALFRDVDGRTAFRSRGIADAVLGEAASAYAEVCADSLRRPRDWADSTVFSVEAQRTVCGLLRRPGLDTDEARRLLAILRACIPGQSPDTAEALVRALAGLAAAQREFVDGRRRYVAGERWEAAFTAYERFLDSVPDGMLDPPPAELRVVAAILDRLVDAGLAVSGR